MPKFEVMLRRVTIITVEVEASDLKTAREQAKEHGAHELFVEGRNPQTESDETTIVRVTSKGPRS